MKKSGQALMEYAIVIIIILAVFLSMQNYIKRGMQGRWKQAVDDFGDQYDPRYVNSKVEYRQTAQSNTTISVQGQTGGYYTNRVDKTSSSEQRIGQTRISQEGGELFPDTQTQTKAGN